MDPDLDLVSGRGQGDGGVPHGALLIRFADAAVSRSADGLRAAREELEQRLGPRALVDAAGVAAVFCCNVRIADATGVALDERTAEVRERIGMRVGVARYVEPEPARDAP